MVIHDFNVEGMPVPPFEAQTPLVVDTDAVLPCAVPVQRLQSVSWRDRQVSKPLGSVYQQQFAPSRSLDSAKSGYRFIEEQAFRIPVAKRTDYPYSLLRMVYYVKRNNARKVRGNHNYPSNTPPQTLPRLPAF